MNPNLTENLRRARRRIEEIEEITLLKDWTWDTVTKRFYLNISISLEHGSSDIPTPLYIPQLYKWHNKYISSPIN